MYETGTQRAGTMSAVIGLDDATAEEACRRASDETGETVVPANYNSPGQLVLSGDGQHGNTTTQPERGLGRYAKHGQPVFPLTGAHERPIDVPLGRSNDPGRVPGAADNPLSIKVGAWHF